MCQACALFRPYADDCTLPQPDSPFLLPDSTSMQMDGTADPGFGVRWIEIFEAPNFAHGRTDIGFMTVNSTFDGGIGGFGDSDWIRIDFVKGKTRATSSG